MTQRSTMIVETLLGYFNAEVPYSQVGAPWVNPVATMQKRICGMHAMAVLNPMHLFKYNSQVDADYSQCAESQMIDTKANAECYNFKQQADVAGNVFAPKTLVLENNYWGIKGNWEVTLLINFLSKSTSSTRWVNSVYDQFAKTKNQLP